MEGIDLVDGDLENFVSGFNSAATYDQNMSLSSN